MLAWMGVIGACAWAAAFPEVRPVLPPEARLGGFPDVSWTARPAEPRPVPFAGETFPSYAFRPGVPVAELLRKAIGLSDVSVRVAVYDLNLEPLVDELAAARARGARVRIVGDLGMLFPDAGEIHPSVRRLLEERFEFRVLRGDGEFGSMHTKIGLFDDALLASGSYNWKDTSEDEHFENALFTDRKDLLEGYGTYWQWLWDNALDAREALALGPDQPYRAPVPPYPPQDPSKDVFFHGEAFPDYAFSPKGGTQALLRRAVQLTRLSADVAMFSFYDFKLAGELARIVRERRASVRLLLDRDQAAASPVPAWLRDKGVQMRVLSGPHGPGPHSRMHNKFAVLDWHFLETGSYNWSSGAENRNFEETRFTNEAEDVRAYAAYFETLWKQAVPLP